MSHGFMIRPDDGGPIIDISDSSRVLSSLGRYKVKGASSPGNSTFVNVGITSMTTGGTAVVIPTKSCEFYELSNPPSVDILRGATVSGSTMRVNFYQENGYGSSSNYIADMNVFEIPAANSGLPAYGIAMYNSVNFLAITDVSRFGYVTYRGTINVNGTWTIPSSVPNRENCVVFARFNSTGTPLWHDRDTNQLRTYTGFGGSGGAGVGGSISNIQIVIVSTGFVPPNPASGYGIVIKNASGVNTYSSKYPPVIWRGGYFPFSFYLENSTGGAGKVQWIGATGNVSQPMVPLGCYGFQCGDYETGGEYPQKIAHYSGLLMSGNSVSTYRCKPAGGQVYFYTSPVRAQMGFNLPCLDAADYF